MSGQGHAAILQPPATGWSVAGASVGLVLLALAAAYWQTVASIGGTWLRSETYAHGFLILPVSGYLVWRRRAALAHLTPRVQWLGLTAVVGLTLLWLAGEAAEVLFLRQVAVVAMIPATAWALLGDRVVRALAFPLAYLVFAVPWGQSLVPYLQDFTAAFSVWLLNLTGIPVFWEGRLISIPTGDFEVAEACSGIRYVIASLAVGCIYAYLSYRSAWKRLAFLGAALLVPVLANGLRAYGIILLAYLSDMRLATGVDHILYGWVFFGVVMLLLFWIGSFWSEDAEPPAEPKVRTGERGGVAPFALLGAAVLAVGLGAGGPVAAGWTDRLRPEVSTRVELPPAGESWRGPSMASPVWDPGFAGADVTRHRIYRRNGATRGVHLLVVHYRRERQGAELINDQNRLYGSEWRRVAGEVRSPGVGHLSAIRELRLASGRENRLIWSWYDIGGWLTARPVLAKAFAALNRLSGGAGDATLVAVAADYPLRPDRARSRLRAFLAAHEKLAAPRGAVRLEE